jgi:hypothetical protein
MTVRYLIDTDWVIDHLNQVERVVNRLKELRPARTRIEHHLSG